MGTGILLRLTVALFWGFAALAQAPTATLTGHITDSTASPVQGTKVVLRHLDTNQQHTTNTNEHGDYTIVNLAPGNYEILIEHTGFHRVKEADYELQVDQTARFDVKLEVGSVNEIVEVKAETPVISTESAVRGDVIANQEIAETPLDGRDFTDIALLVAGVGRKAQGASGSGFTINGARSDNTNFVIDGFNDQNPRGGTAQARPPIDALMEFKMQTSNYPAELGRLAGGVMNVVLKTGGNRIHGTLFEYLRNDKFDARNFFDPTSPSLRRNQFGGIVDGPVIIPKLYNGHNKTFFLGSWESYRQRVGINKLGQVPTELERSGDFSKSVDAGAAILLKDPFNSAVCTTTSRAGCYANNRLPLSLLSPVAAKLIAYYPKPNRADVNNFGARAKDADNWDSYLGKLDHRFKDRDTFSARYLRRNNDTGNPFAGSPIPTFGNRTNESQELGGVSWTHLFSPTLINEARVGLTRTVDHVTNLSDDKDYSRQFGIAGATTDPRLVGFPRITIRDLVALGGPNANPVDYFVTTYQYADTMTLVRSNHVVKFGFDMLHTQFYQTANDNSRGTFNFLGRWTNSPFADFMLGLLNNTSRQQSTLRSYLYSGNQSLFVQDDYKVRPNVTLNIGLRYEFLHPMSEKYGRLANYIPELGKLVFSSNKGLTDFDAKISAASLAGKVVLAKDAGIPDSLVYSPKDTFAPRFGFAYRPRGSHSAVIRGGYGIYIGNSISNPVRGDLAATFPFIVSQTFARTATNVKVLTFDTPFPDGKLVLADATNSAGYELHAKAQNIQSWNLTTEKMIGASSAIEIAYIGSKGTHLSRRYNINQPFYDPKLKVNGNFVRPFPNFNTINYYSFGSNSTFNSGVVTLRRNFRNGIFYRASYTYAKSIDDASQISGNSAGGYPGAQDPRNLKLDRGRSDFDVGHSFLMSFSAVSPWKNAATKGWTLSGSGRAYTGMPFTPRTSNFDLATGEANRPDRIRKGSLDNPTAQRWYDVSAFPLVPTNAFRFGTAGRNILDGPGFMALNFALARRWTTSEHTSLQFRWEVFNAANHTNFNLPENMVNAANAGSIITAADSRQMQFGLKFHF